MSTTGRNDACPCRSGKKYKHCCQSGRVSAPQPLADALHWQGVAACESGDSAAALDLLTRATVERSHFPEAHYHLGLFHMNHGRLDQAASHYRQAIAQAPALMEAHANLGTVLNRLGQPGHALACYEKALALGEAVEVKIGLAECLQRLPMGSTTAALRPVLTRAITEAWRRPEELASAAIGLLVAEPRMRAALARGNAPAVHELSEWTHDELLLRLLENAAVNDAALERWLTAARATLLKAALEQSGHGVALMDLCAALARQCFINEYVWACGAEELELLEQLKTRWTNALDTDHEPCSAQLLALASYVPLHSLPGADALLDRLWPAPVRAVLRQQIEEPGHEERLRATIPRLTDIEDGVSSLVRGQYEDNPYPRWAKSSLFPAPVLLGDHLRALFPHANLRLQPPGEGLDILVAGCGTGRHSTETASRYHGARVLAIDLSARSLGFAMRKTRDIGLTNIEYAQADILQLGHVTRRFDLIEAVGVLHHLADPAAGWRVLLSLLRPGGVMLIGLYSELARAPVVAARRFIAEQGFSATTEGIQACRQALMAHDGPDDLKVLTRFGDFYGTSACRDLLFHEQEHRYTPLAIQALLDTLGLDLLGLHVEPSVLNHFRSRFPGEADLNNLLLWHQYETENPRTFEGMVQFWVQKRIPTQ